MGRGPLRFPSPRTPPRIGPSGYVTGVPPTSKSWLRHWSRDPDHAPIKSALSSNMLRLYYLCATVSLSCTVNELSSLVSQNLRRSREVSDNISLTVQDKDLAAMEH